MDGLSFVIIKNLFCKLVTSVLDLAMGKKDTLDEMLFSGADGEHGLVKALVVLGDINALGELLNWDWVKVSLLSVFFNGGV